MNKLILGTAQFGSDYGIKHDGQPSIQEIEKIARVAWDGGIRIIHTSWQYNLPKICEAIFDEFDQIYKGNVDPKFFCWQEKAGFQMIGKSLYHPSEMDGSCRAIQIPVNVLDNRFKNIWENKDGLVIARSVFLQGLLLMKRKELPPWINLEVGSLIETFQAISKIKFKLEPYETALGWVLGLDEIDKVIIGVNSAEQLRQLLQVKPLKWDYDFSITDENVLDPRRWPTMENQLKRTVETSTAVEGVNIKL